MLLLFVINVNCYNLITVKEDQQYVSCAGISEPGEPWES